MISLAVGRLEVDWGKNNGFVDYSPLFQSGDVTDVPYYYAGHETIGPDGRADGEVRTELKDGLSKPLSQVIDRINLLGHTKAVCEREFASLAEWNGFDPKSFSFGDLRGALSTIDVSALSPNYGEGGEDFGKFFRREIHPRLGLISLDPMELGDVSGGMENLSAYTILHLLADNTTARDLNVQWSFNDVEEGGWASRSEFVRPLDQTNRFLLVTEGSSDAAILRKALGILKPHVADFFDFVDMEEGYPFSGTGNVFRFVQGLISIRVLNNVIVIYDNDAEGIANFERTLGLNLPHNMSVLRLPDWSEFERFPTQGPNGQDISNINGRAAAIECYLDLPADARIRWSSFIPKVGTYQGELIDKERYARSFLKQSAVKAHYDYGKLGAVLDSIIGFAVAMRERTMAETYARRSIQHLTSL